MLFPQRENSLLSYEGFEQKGVSEITTRFSDPNIANIRHSVSAVTGQAAAEGALIVLVTGSLATEYSDEPLNYVQAFHLILDNGRYYILNDIFKIFS